MTLKHLVETDVKMTSRRQKWRQNHVMHESRLTPPYKTTFPSPSQVHGNPGRVGKKTCLCHMWTTKAQTPKTGFLMMWLTFITEKISDRSTVAQLKLQIPVAITDLPKARRNITATSSLPHYEGNIIIPLPRVAWRKIYRTDDRSQVYWFSATGNKLFPFSRYMKAQLDTFWQQWIYC